jgi:hypothetical protein
VVCVMQNAFFVHLSRFDTERRSRPLSDQLGRFAEVDAFTHQCLSVGAGPTSAIASEAERHYSAESNERQEGYDEDDLHTIAHESTLWRHHVSLREADVSKIASELLAAHPGLNVALGLALGDARALLDH